MMEKIYRCDICTAEKKPSELTGLYFSSLNLFRFSNAEKTDGKHICTECLPQIVNEFNKESDENILSEER